MNFKTLLEAIREAGIPWTCPAFCELDIDREPGSMALYCVTCGWRYDLTEAERKEVFRLYRARKDSRGPRGRKTDIERERRILESYRKSVPVADIAAIEGLTASAIYDTLKRLGVKVGTVTRGAHV